MSGSGAEPGPAGARWAMAVLVGCGSAGTALSWYVAQHSLIGSRWRFFVPIGAWTALWLVGAWSARRVGSGRLTGRRAAVVAILVVGGAARLASATGSTPSISNDLYRYGWDAHVQLSGLDPYRYPPSAPQLVPLRVPPYFPAPAGCGRLGQAPGCTTLNRPSDRTIYPPVAEAWFDVVHFVVPGGPVRQWQLAGAAVDMATLGLLMIGLRGLGRDPREAAWYALCPVPVIEFAGNGHVDGLALVLLLGALLALRRGRRALAGGLIGLATMVKLYPAVAVAAAWRRGRVPMLLAFGAVAGLSYAPHVAVVGARVAGYLPGYLKEEHYSNGGRFLLVGTLELLAVPPHLVAAAAVVLVVSAAAWVLYAGPIPEQGTALLLAVLVLVTTPVQPWYAVTLAGVGLLGGGWWLVTPALFGELYYAAVVLDYRHQVAAGRLAYGSALALIAAGVRAGAGRRVPDAAGRRRASEAGRPLLGERGHALGEGRLSRHDVQTLGRVSDRGPQVPVEVETDLTLGRGQ